MPGELTVRYFRRWTYAGGYNADCACGWVFSANTPELLDALVSTHTSEHHPAAEASDAG